MAQSASASCYIPSCYDSDHGKCDPHGFWGSVGRLTLLSTAAAAAIAAVATGFLIISYLRTGPVVYVAIPLGLATLSGVLYVAWKICVYRNAHLAGESFQLCGYPIACLSDPPPSDPHDNRFVSSPSCC